MYHMIGCPCVSYFSFMIKPAKRCLQRKERFLKRVQSGRIMNKICQIIKIPLNPDEKESPYILHAPIRGIYQSICSAAFVGHSSWDQAIKRGRACS